MNANRLLNMVMRLFVRQGIDTLARGGRNRDDMTKEERQAARKRRQSMQTANRSIKLLRRFMR